MGKRVKYKDTDYFVDGAKGIVYRNGKEVGYQQENGRYIIRMGRKESSVRRAKMVAETFLGMEEGQEVHHINEKPWDDRKNNLICLSHLQHQRVHNHSVITLQFDKDYNLVGAYNSKLEAERSLGYGDGSLNIRYASEEGKLLKGFYWLYLLDLPKKFIFVGDESVADLRRDLLDYAYSQLLVRSGVWRPYAPQINENQALTLMEGIRFI